MIGAGERGKQMEDMDFDYKYVSVTGVFTVPGRMEKRIPNRSSFDRIYDTDSGGGHYLFIVQ